MELSGFITFTMLSRTCQHKERVVSLFSMPLLAITTSTLRYVFDPDPEDVSGNFGAPMAGSGYLWLLWLAMARWRDVMIAQSAVTITLQPTTTITLIGERKFDTSSIMKALTVSRDIV